VEFERYVPAAIYVVEENPMNQKARQFIWIPIALVWAVVLPWPVACADDAPPSLDLGALAPWDDGGSATAENDVYVEADERPTFLPPTVSVAHELSAPSDRRFYLTSIVGGSFLVISANNSPDACVTGGAAAGLALERSNGRIRLEAEGRYRSFIEQTYLGFNEDFSPRNPNPVGIVRAANLGGWSVLANVWRDFRCNDRFDLYGGGGIGAIGYGTSFQQISGKDPNPATTRYETGYAWQIGVGGIWNVNDRIAVDASYRVFGVGWTMTRSAFATGFPRNEILISLRIFEPFRGLMR
jgi:opacity protein-like surface antigen